MSIITKPLLSMAGPDSSPEISPILCGKKEEKVAAAADRFFLAEPKSAESSFEAFAREFFQTRAPFQEPFVLGVSPFLLQSPKAPSTSLPEATATLSPIMRSFSPHEMSFEALEHEALPLSGHMRLSPEFAMPPLGNGLSVSPLNLGAAKSSKENSLDPLNTAFIEAADK